MARMRTIKPGFFTNDLLAETGPLGQLLFAGLWTQADREGRLEDRPLRINAVVFPYYEADVNGLLDALQERGFLVRYTSGGMRYIQIQNFLRHQNPHIKEQPSAIPAPVGYDAHPEQVSDMHGANTVPAACQHGASPVSHGVWDVGCGIQDNPPTPLAGEAPVGAVGVDSKSDQPEKPKATRQRAAIPVDWAPSPGAMASARAKYPGVTTDQLVTHAERFRLWWLADGRPKKSWDLTWHNRLAVEDPRRAPQAAHQNGAAPPAGPVEDPARVQAREAAHSKAAQEAAEMGMTPDEYQDYLIGETRALMAAADVPDPPPITPSEAAANRRRIETIVRSLARGEVHARA